MEDQSSFFYLLTFDTSSRKLDWKLDNPAFIWALQSFGQVFDTILTADGIIESLDPSGAFCASDFMMKNPSNKDVAVLANWSGQLCWFMAVVWHLCSWNFLALLVTEEGLSIFSIWKTDTRDPCAGMVANTRLPWRRRLCKGFSVAFCMFMPIYTDSSPFSTPSRFATSS